jgi:proline iminopeptidase
MAPSRFVPTLVLLVAACGSKPKDSQVAADTAKVAAPMAPTLPPGEAFLAVAGGKIWYRVVGTGPGTPVILLHGGPGFSSYYLKLFERLGDDRKVVRYDQLGGGKSDRIADTTMYTIAHFVAELDSLRSHLGYDKVHILGHSWGTILGYEYYRAHPDHVASLTLGSAALDIPTWEKNAKRLLTTLSDSAQKAVAEAEKTKRYDSPGYQAADQEFFAKYVMLHPIPADLDSTMTQIAEGIYNYLQGPSEFTITGTLKTYNVVPQLKDIKVPTLFTVGSVDEANPATIKKQAALVPGAKVVVIEGAAHMTPWDNPDQNLLVVRDFLKGVDAAKKP